MFRRAAVTCQLLLIAEPVLAAGLTRWLEGAPDAAIRPVQAAEELNGAPDLVLWRPADATPLAVLQREATLLRERWQPAPLLIVLGSGHGLDRAALLLLPAEGLLEAPDADLLHRAIATLRQGGRVVELCSASGAVPPSSQRLSIGQALLVGGLQQIDVARCGCRLLLERTNLHPLARLMLEGRLRELGAARRLLLWLWGPLSLAWPDQGPDQGETGGAAPAANRAANRAALVGSSAPARTSLTLQQRNAAGVWSAVQQRLTAAIEAGPANHTGQLLAIEGLNPQRRIDLLIALLHQLDCIRRQLAEEVGQSPGDAAALLAERWPALQRQLRQQALVAMASPYVQLPRDGALRPVAVSLVEASDPEAGDPELPDAQAMLATLVLARPLLVDGRLLPADEPQAVLHLERLVSNWLLRSAELLAADVLACCGDWPDLRRYLLRPELLSTRNLERLRNQLNAQQRWLSWFQRPIALYESRRELLCLDGSQIATLQLLEPRDQELRQLGWLQQLVALALEARDALAPQLRQLISGVGNLLVVLLTQVVGRAIGLVGRGILQGMGRSIGRS